ncbi:U6 snRNA phosphodiesterase 1 [Neocloeon triangulifer]|uniref:U6 snRNA phosphodiesterase 1 n=1 Tax=Neocloeon triangulifer TaxID=2078957 RepID=UPI00286F428D|nr:U6 snRNA phosphodiesterase 1 [Neocloeon triangulifer]
MDLLKNYGSSASSESEEEEKVEKEVDNKPTRLEVPSSIKSLFGDAGGQHQDDPSLHQGRVRGFAHERGLWAGLVSIEVGPPLEDWTRLLNQLSDVSPCPEPLHVSLSRPLQLRHLWISSLVADLRKRASKLLHFEIIFGDVTVLVNEERTRTFVCVDAVGSGLETACSLAEAAGAEYRLPPYYEGRRFHVSIGWALGDQETRLKAALANLVLPSPASFAVTQLQLKAGNQQYQIPLQHR